MEKYETPDMEIVQFEAEDVITASLAANELCINWDEVI